MAYAFNPSTQEVGRPGKFKASLVYRAGLHHSKTPSQKQTKNKKKRKRKSDFSVKLEISFPRSFLLLVFQFDVLGKQEPSLFACCRQAARRSSRNVAAQTRWWVVCFLITQQSTY